MDNCVLCGGRIGAEGWVWMMLYEPNAKEPCKTGYVCKKCQLKHNLVKEPERDE